MWNIDLTNKYYKVVENTKIKILDTRKNMLMEIVKNMPSKLVVRHNHRNNLKDKY